MGVLEDLKEWAKILPKPAGFYKPMPLTYKKERTKMERNTNTEKEIAEAIMNVSRKIIETAKKKLEEESMKVTLEEIYGETSVYTKKEFEKAMNDVAIVVEGATLSKAAQKLLRPKVAIIGSSGLYPQMREHFMKLHKEGIQGMMVKEDWDGRRIEDIIDTNKKRIREADEVHLFWDGKSPGTILDLGMAIALNKPLKIMHLEEKSIPEYIKKYAARFENEKSI